MTEPAADEALEGCRTAVTTAVGRWPCLGVLYRLSRRYPSAPVFLLVSIAAALALGLIYVAARGQDEVAIDRSQRMIEALLAAQIRDVGKEAQDYAHWDDAVTRLAVAPDTAWADRNVGRHAFAYLQIFASFVVPAQGVPEIAFVAGEQVSPRYLLTRFGGGLARLAAAARAADPDAPGFQAGLVSFDGLPFIAGAAAITPEAGGLSPVQAGERAVLVFLRAIDEELLASLSREFSIAGLSLVTAAAPAAALSYALRSADGRPLGHLVWALDLPGRHLVRETLLSLALAFLLLAGLGLTILRTMKGTTRNLEASLTLLAERNAKLTASERAAAALQARLQNALEYSPEAIAFFDCDGGLIVCNERFRRLMHPGYRHLVVPGQSLDILCQTYAKAWFGSAEAGDGRRWLAHIRAFRARDGETTEIGMACSRWMLLRRRWTADGGFVMLFTDITQLHGRHQNLTDRSSRLQVTLDSLGEGVALFGPDERLLLCNARYAEILGLSADALRPGTPFDTLLPWFASCRRLERDGEAGLEPAGAAAGLEDLPAAAEYVTPAQRIVKVRHAPAPDGALVATFRDVTEQRIGERELRAAMEDAELANRSKTEFLANVSHELRTPLNAIIGFSEIMREELFGPLGGSDYRGYANDIHESGRHLLSLINDILDLAKIEAGRSRLNEERVDIAEVSASALRIVRERAQAAGLTIGAKLPHELPPVLADQRAIKQILINLLSNAIKFTPTQGVVTLHGGLAGNGDMRIAVSDTGIGIADEDIPTALLPFAQVDGSMTRSVQGTGLGLPLSNALAKDHGGRIEIASTIGRGTEVTLVLPAARVQPPAQTA